MVAVPEPGPGAVATPPTDQVLDLFHGIRLTPTQRRIAHSLVQHAASAAYLSAAEIAELAQVSQPSVTRFAIALGYDGYPALRRRLRQITAVERGRPASDVPAGNELQRAVSAEVENLHRLAEQLTDPDKVTTAGALLANSRPLPVLGLRAAAPLAAYFAYFAAKVHPDVRVLDTGGACSPTGSTRPVRPARPHCSPSCCRATRASPSTRSARRGTPVSPSW